MTEDGTRHPKDVGKTGGVGQVAEVWEDAACWVESGCDSIDDKGDAGGEVAGDDFDVGCGGSDFNRDGFEDNGKDALKVKR